MAKAHQYYPPDKVEVTPSGVRIEFYDQHAKSELGPGQRRHYLIDGEQPDTSVTGALEVLDKPALKSWAQRIGIAGAIDLARTGNLPQDTAAAEDALRARGLCWWDVRRHAGERGDLAHDELIRLASGGRPRFATYPPEQLGYVRAICAFYADYRPRVIATEQMVASVRHSISGRLDMRCALEVPLLSGVGLIDLKSLESLHDKDGKLKDPYLENVLQLGAYEGLSVESGHPPTDFRAVLRVDAKGNYDLRTIDATFDDFLAVLEVWCVCRRLKNGTPKPEAVPA